MKQIALDPNESPSENTVQQVARYAVGMMVGANRATPHDIDQIPKQIIASAVSACVVNANELDSGNYDAFLDAVHAEAYEMIGEEQPEPLLSNR